MKPAQWVEMTIKKEHMKRRFTPVKWIKPNRQRRYLTGFTLIELLIVVAIIGILSTVVILQVSGAKKKAILAMTQQQGTETYKAAEMFLALGGDISSIKDKNGDGYMDDEDAQQFVDDSGTPFLNKAPAAPQGSTSPKWIFRDYAYWKGQTPGKLNRVTWRLNMPTGSQYYFYSCYIGDVYLRNDSPGCHYPGTIE